MGGKGKNLIGQTFGKLTVIKETGKRKWHCKVWLCKCKCGGYIETTTNHLTMGNTKSCGCTRKEKLRKIQLDMCCKHGQSKTRLYNEWTGVKERCYNPKATYYEYYGGKGIKMCDEWIENFMLFHDWAIEHGYNDKLTLDRINGNKDYCPENCRWVTMKEQNENRKSNIIVNYKGKNYTLSNLSKEMNVNVWALYSRYRRGVRPPELFEPVKPSKPPIIVEINAEFKTISEWSRIYGVEHATIAYRLKRGFLGEDLIKKPKNPKKGA